MNRADWDASACDETLFQGWVKRIEKGLGGIDKPPREGSKRMNLIHEIHLEIGNRYPLGISIVLAEAKAALAVAEKREDEEAVTLLLDLMGDESQSRLLNCPNGRPAK